MHLNPRNWCTALFVTVRLLAFMLTMMTRHKFKKPLLLKVKFVILFLSSFLRLISLIRKIMSSQEKLKTIEDAKRVAPFFSINLRIAIFGVTIWEFQFPPKK